jgi:transposase
MAKGYRRADRDQPFLLPPDMREWLPADHPVWLVIRAVEDHLDTSAFHAGRRTGGAGTAGYDPDMLVALLMWAYAQGLTSSRRIEAACWQDVSFRVICAGDVPDHVTIARFRAAFGGPVKDLFREVLVLCAKLGMGKLGTIALDGTKITANASKAANRSEESLRKLAAQEAAKAVAAHAAADAAEDELFGEGQRGDEVPPEAVNPATRAARIAAALADLEAERKAAQEAREAQRQQRMEAAAAGTPLTGRPPAGTEVALAARRVARLEDAQLAKIADWERRTTQRKAAGQPLLPGPGPRPPAQCARVRDARAALAKAQAAEAQAERKAADQPDPVRNITDPGSRLMPVRGGAFIQGYNAQNVTSEDKLIIAEELTNDTNDAPWFEPMLAAAADAAALITARQPPPASTTPDDQGSPAGQGSGIGQVLADAGYCSEHNLTIAGPDRLIATGKHRHLEEAARRAAAGQGTSSDEAPDSPIAAMAARLATPEGITAYRRRGHIAETPHGQIKHNMGIRRLAMRGKPKAAAEWTFTCAVHNLLKAITTGHLTPATLAALPS